MNNTGIAKTTHRKRHTRSTRRGMKIEVKGKCRYFKTGNMGTTNLKKVEETNKGKSIKNKQDTKRAGDTKVNKGARKIEGKTR